MRNYLWLIAILLAFQAHADCRIRPDAVGNARYHCDNGESGILRKDSTGAVRDSRTGTTWRKDSFGNVRGSDGSRYRPDSFGNVRSSDGTTWRKDRFGNVRASDGTNCRTDSFGKTSCK